mgnify:CR=1 FL=1
MRPLPTLVDLPELPPGETLIDSHCHLDMEAFDGDRQAVLDRAARAHVQTMVTIGAGGPLGCNRTAIDLDEAAWKAALEITLRAWNPDPARQKDNAEPKPPQLPNGPAIRRVRGEGAEGVPAALERGVLLLYPLDPKQAGEGVFEDRTEPVMAFGISFPTSKSGMKVEYKVDHLKWEQWEHEYGPAD